MNEHRRLQDLITDGCCGTHRPVPVGVGLDHLTAISSEP